MNVPLRQLVAILGSVLLCLLLTSCGKTELKKRTLGYKGEARSNAFLAAQRYLAEIGYEVESRSGLGKLDDSVSTIFIPTSSLNTVGRGKRVMNWVDNGGRIIVMLGNGGRRGNDFTPYDYVEFDEESDELPGVEYLLNELALKTVQWDDEEPGEESDEVENVEVLDRDSWEEIAESERVLLNSTAYPFSFGGDTLTVHQWSSKHIQRGISEDEDSDFYIREYYGEGMVTLLSDASPLRNRYIGYADHAVFLEMLLVGSSDEWRAGKVVFSNGVGDGLFALLWRYFRLAVIGVAVVIVFWLWKNLPRFGPEKDVPESQMREFLTQLRGNGRFLWRYKRDDAMLDALRGAINRKANREATEDSKALAQLAERASLPLQVTIEAMTRKNIRDQSAMVRVVKNLQTILKTIN